MRIVIAAVLLYYVFSSIGLRPVINVIGRADESMLWLAFVVAVIVQVVVSYRLRRLTDVHELGLPTLLVFEVNLATRFYGLFLPGGNVTALLIRIFKFTRERSKLASVVVSLFTDRIMATLSLCIVGIISWELARPKPDERWLLVLAFATVICSIFAFVLFNRSSLLKLGRIAPLLRRHSQSLGEKLSRLFQHSGQMGVSVLVSSLTLSILAHLVGIVGYWLVARSLEMELPILVIAWIRSAMMLVTILPISFAGLGIREVAALTVLQKYGVEPDIAVAFSMLVFATTSVGIGLLGGLVESWRFLYSRRQ